MRNVRPGQSSGGILSEGMPQLTRKGGRKGQNRAEPPRAGFGIIAFEVAVAAVAASQLAAEPAAAAVLCSPNLTVFSEACLTFQLTPGSGQTQPIVLGAVNVWQGNRTLEEPPIDHRMNVRLGDAIELRHGDVDLADTATRQSNSLFKRHGPAVAFAAASILDRRIRMASPLSRARRNQSTSSEYRSDASNPPTRSTARRRMKTDGLRYFFSQFR